MSNETTETKELQKPVKKEEIWTTEEKGKIKSEYGCEMLVENGSLQDVSISDVPTDAFIVTYSVFESGKLGPSMYDLTRGSKTKSHWQDYGGATYDYGGTQAPHWRHIAISRDASKIYAFVDGNCIYRATHSTNIANDRFRIGGNGSTGIYGYISNVRFVKGQCLYKKDFSVATALMPGI